MTQPRTEKGKRIERAPSSGPGAPPGVISVVVGEDEDVRWCWTHYPDGRSVVTGYEVIKRGRESFEEAVEGVLRPGEGGKRGGPRPWGAPDKALKLTARRQGFPGRVRRPQAGGRSRAPAYRQRYIATVSPTMKGL